jgi:hypothetical protein
MNERDDERRYAEKARHPYGEDPEWIAILVAASVGSSRMADSR